MKLLIVVERTETGFSAHSPDLPGCIATGSNRDVVEQEMRDAISLHLEGMRAAGYPLPEPSSYATYVEVAA
jgi:predicted RNase H-like HicB family nuclease